MTAAEPARRGHRARPHTADVRIEAWAPTAEGCYEEAVAAFVEIFADLADAPEGAPRPFQVGPGSPERLVVLLLDEVLTLLDAEGLVPRAAHVERHGDGLAGVLTLVPLDAVQITGSVAKGVSYSGLEFRHGEGEWRCQAIVDV